MANDILKICFINLRGFIPTGVRESNHDDYDDQINLLNFKKYLCSVFIHESPSASSSESKQFLFFRVFSLHLFSSVDCCALNYPLFSFFQYCLILEFFWFVADPPDGIGAIRSSMRTLFKPYFKMGYRSLSELDLLRKESK